MIASASFRSRLEEQVIRQLGSKCVGYLLGAGASHLGGDGYPLADDLWRHIAAEIPAAERGEIQTKLDAGADGLEQALDLLDAGTATECAHRGLVTDAIAEHFRSLSPPTGVHRAFVHRLGLRQECDVPIFCLNYDALVELSADEERVRVVDGFCGVEQPFFDPQVFQETVGLCHRGRRGRRQVDWRTGLLHLYKLHGSLGWFDFGGTDIRRLGARASTPDGAKRLMIPPQRRKAVETTAPPYAALWSQLRARLCHGPYLLNRLVAIGYGLRDEHVNAIIENALGRSSFTLLVLTHNLGSDVFDRWSSRRNAVIVTSEASSLNGEVGPGHADLCRFEEVAGRV